MLSLMSRTVCQPMSLSSKVRCETPLCFYNVGYPPKWDFHNGYQFYNIHVFGCTPSCPTQQMSLCIPPICYPWREAQPVGQWVWHVRAQKRGAKPHFVFTIRGTHPNKRFHLLNLKIVKQLVAYLPVQHNRRPACIPPLCYPWRVAQPVGRWARQSYWPSWSDAWAWVGSPRGHGSSRGRRVCSAPCGRPAGSAMTARSHWSPRSGLHWNSLMPAKDTCTYHH